ncbi:MAG: glycine dehydrogenase, partial [Desulfotignum sp.]
LRSALTAAGFTPVFDSPFFNEFVMKVPEGFKKKRADLIHRHCLFAGLDLTPFYPELTGHYLFCATEKISRQQMDQLAKEVA